MGRTPPAKERRGVARPKGNLRGRFGPNPGFSNIWRYSPYHIFRFVGNATQVWVAYFGRCVCHMIFQGMSWAGPAQPINFS